MATFDAITKWRPDMTKIEELAIIKDSIFRALCHLEFTGIAESEINEYIEGNEVTVSLHKPNKGAWRIEIVMQEQEVD